MSATELRWFSTIRPLTGLGAIGTHCTGVQLDEEIIVSAVRTHPSLAWVQSPDSQPAELNEIQVSEDVRRKGEL